jgi:hypothetical protein
MLDEYQRARVLNTLVERPLAKRWKQVFDIAQTIQKDQLRYDILYKLNKLAQRLPKEQLIQISKEMWLIHDEKKFANTLFTLRKFWPQKGLTQLLIKMLLTEQPFLNSTIDVPFAWLLIILLPLLPKKLLYRGIEMSKTIHNLAERAVVLSILAQRLPEATIKALELAQAISDEQTRANALITIAQNLPKYSLGQMLIAARTIDNASNRASVMVHLVRNLLKIPLPMCYEYMEVSIKESSRNIRSELFSDIVALMPVIIHLGTEDTRTEIYSAVRDVTTWWP